MNIDKKLLRHKQHLISREIRAKYGTKLDDQLVKSVAKEAMDSVHLNGFPESIREGVALSVVDQFRASVGSNKKYAYKTIIPSSPYDLVRSDGHMDSTPDLRSNVGSIAGSLLTDRAQAALLGSAGWNNRQSLETPAQFKGKIKRNGVELSPEQALEEIDNIRLWIDNLSQELKGLFRIIFTLRTDGEGPKDIDCEEIVRAATLALEIFDATDPHPSWRDKKQKTGTFETEMTLCARIWLALDAKPGLLSIEEFFACCEAVRSNRGQAPNLCWNYFFRSADAHHRLSQGKFKEFLYLWGESNFARLNVGHKLAAALALTDAPEMVLEAPWKAWSLAIPEGFFENIHRDEAVHETDGLSTAIMTLKRAWFIGTEMIGIGADNSGPQGGTAVVWMDQMAKVLGGDIVEMIRNLGMGSIAVIENHPARSTGSWGAVRSKENPKRLDAPAIGASYELAAPVTIDLRDDPKKAINGQRGGRGSSPKAYWIVRGHHKLQVHGEKRALRKKIWVQPYPKGDPSMKVLLRTTKVEE